MIGAARTWLVGAALALTMGGAAQAANCALPPNAANLMAQAVAEMNAARAAQGRAKLSRDAKLDQAAQAHACWMGATGTFSHKGKGGSLPKKRIRATGYRTSLTAENIAWGQKTAREVVDVWMKSDGHRRNILLSGVDEVGIGVAMMNGRIAWVMDFASN
jgi:uncharacterized protein YkwD